MSSWSLQRRCGGGGVNPGRGADQAEGMTSSAQSGGSSSRSSSQSRFRLDGAAAASPIPYQEGPLEYSPPYLCLCGMKAARWISWSDNNPGRRYYKCMRSRSGGCGMFTWAEESTTTPFVKQLLRDLRDMVWELRREGANLSAALDEARENLQEAGNVQAAKLKAMKAELKCKNEEATALNARVRKLEKERVVFLLAFAVVCAAVVMFRLM